jgi:hypothetical protein
MALRQSAGLGLDHQPVLDRGQPTGQPFQFPPILQQIVVRGTGEARGLQVVDQGVQGSERAGETRRLDLVPRS